MRHPWHARAITRFLVTAVVLGGCSDAGNPPITGVGERIAPPQAAGLSRAGAPIEVTTVDGLYAAVNSPRNAGRTVHLASGQYLLSATDGGGAARPNNGALRLQPRMRLVGSEQRVDYDRDGVPDEVAGQPSGTFALATTATVIDGSALHPAVQQVTDCAMESISGSDPVIQLGEGNSLANLTVHAGASRGVGEPVHPIGADASITATVVNTVLEGTTPMTLGNDGCTARHAHSTLEFLHNVVRGSTGSQAGLNLLNLRTGGTAGATRGPTIIAVVAYNRFVANGTALIVRGGAQGTTHASVVAALAHNIFFGNGSNVLAMAGFAKTTRRPTDANVVTLSSYADVFGAPTGALGSVQLIGARFPAGEVGKPTSNTLSAHLQASRFLRDVPTSAQELSILGAEGGSNNHATLLMHGATVSTSSGAPAHGTISIANERPVADGSNSARLLGSPASFRATNSGFDAPAATFFRP